MANQYTTLLRFQLVILSITPLMTGGVFAASEENTAAEYLLSLPTDSNWSLDAIVASGQKELMIEKSLNTNDKQDKVREHVHTVIRHNHDAVSNSLESRVRQLIAQRKADQQTITHLTAELHSVKQIIKSQNVNTSEAPHLKTAFEEKEALKSGKLESAFADKTVAIDKMQSDITSPQDSLAQKHIILASPQLQPKPAVQSHPKDRIQTIDAKAYLDKIETLTSKIANKENILSEVQGLLAKNSQDVVSLRRKNEELNASLKQQTADNISMRNKLVLSESELHQASTGLADIRQKMSQQDEPNLDNKIKRQAYMAGVMLSGGLAERLASWKDAGVALDDGLFRAGLIDGLRNTVRLKENEGLSAKNTFSQRIQNAATAKVVASQKQMQELAKGRTLLKSGGGIVWYLLHKGRVVPAPKPVTLSMTEQVAGGKIISRIKTLTLNDSDDMPVIIRDGLRLPGDGGEVMAYALASSIYGNVQLPPGVRPWTVMEYHLRGTAAAR